MRKKLMNSWFKVVGRGGEEARFKRMEIGGRDLAPMALEVGMFVDSDWFDVTCEIRWCT